MNAVSNLHKAVGCQFLGWLTCLSVCAQEPARFTSIEVLPNREVKFGFSSLAGGVWRLETSGNLADWEGWRTFRSTGADHHLDSGAAYRGQRFFRAVKVTAAGTLTGDHLPTASGDLVIHPVNQATLVLVWNGRTLYVDPVGGAELFAGLPRADLILITHAPDDRLEAETIHSVRGPEAVIVAPPAVYGVLPATLQALTTVLTNGSSTHLLDLTVEAVPAYGLTTTQHPRGVGNGYLVTLGGKRVYVSGDTEDVPEMRALRDIDVAFLSMNQPDTMRVSQAASAVREFRPKVVYPRHDQNQDGSIPTLQAFKQQVGTDLGIEVRAAAPGDPELNVGAPVDVAPWGERASWAGGRDIGLWWEDPRDIERVVVTFDGNERPPDPATAKLQWWQSRWPVHRIPRDRPAGAGLSGWTYVGDLYQGQWLEAGADVQTEGRTWTWTFRPVNLKEFPDLTGFDARYRTTMKLRLLFDGPAPAVEKFEAYTDSVWRQVGVAIQWQRPEAAPSARLDVFNGRARYPVRRGLDEFRDDPQGRAGERLALIWFAESPNVNTLDGTIVTVRTPESSFSFAPAAVAAGSVVFAPSLGVGIEPWDRQGTYERMQRETEERRRHADLLPLSERVGRAPEQSLARALAEQPPKRGRLYLPLGTAGGRQRFAVSSDGSVSCVNDRIDHPPGKDSGRLRWGARGLTYDFALPKTTPTRRWIEDDCLPIMNTQWEREGIRYTQTAFVTRLEPGSLGFPDMQADDTAVLLVKVHGRNIAQNDHRAHATLSLRADRTSLPLVLREGLLYAQHPDGDRLRAAVEVQGSIAVTADSGQIHFAGDLPPGAEGFVVLRIPFLTLETQEEVTRLQDLEYDVEVRRVKSFWQERADVSTQITTPVPEINRFYRAHVSHLLINCGREVGSDRLNARVGSFSYGVYGNESCMMITDLDRRGFHAEAERCLDTFLEYQGTVALPGDYSSRDGVFNGANGWEAGGYNQHHGWILWALAEHYWYTGDRAWLARHADKLLNACRWIRTERERTKNLTGLRAIERGLLPPGALEDIVDWRCWLANNAFSWWGMHAVARALTDVTPAEAAALQAEADAYRRDTLAAFREASARSPLVPLRDGTWIPQIPSEVHRRGRTFGWITVTLEGPIYFLRTGLMAPDDPLAAAILLDYEDNLYLSDRYGYSWQTHGAQWFSRGGISMQPNLLCSPHPYLLRDEIPHFLRAYFNAFAACYYPDTQMLCEHPLPELGDWWGDHYKSSDESNSTYWLRLMFIEDDRGDGVLRLGMALPRAWLADGETAAIERAATHFGPMNLWFESKAGSGQITAMLDAPSRRAPKQILLRFRHPEQKPIRRVEVNGKAWDRFDPAREWVDLTGISGQTTVTAFY